MNRRLILAGLALVLTCVGVAGFGTANAQGQVRIRDIQGVGHVSPLLRRDVTDVPGIVTAVLSDGFFMQDAQPDNNDATSEGLFVFLNGTPNVAVGSSVLVSGRVGEFRAGGQRGTNNLTLTQISSRNSNVRVVNTIAGESITPTVIGIGGRHIPDTIISDDTGGDVETNTFFDPQIDGLDFYESLEGMLIQINNPVVVGPTNNFGEMIVLADNGVQASIRTARGGIVITASDQNPERILLDDEVHKILNPGAPVPLMNVGDSMPGTVFGVLGYDFGNYRVQVFNYSSVISGGLQREVTDIASPQELTIATFNVENLSPNDGLDKFSALADRIVINLRSPDIIAVQEVQDNNGATNDGTVDATLTWNGLIDAIANARGPQYQFVQIDPVNNADGGEPGGNIRQGFLYNPARVQLAGGTPGDSVTAVTVTNAGGSPRLSVNPGRIDPTNTAFESSRKPIAVEFTFNNRSVFVIANHFNSKGGDTPLFGRQQPPTLTSETQRTAQARIVNTFVNSVLTVDSNANIVVLGDLNDFEFSNPLQVLKGNQLANMADLLPKDQRYSYVFTGNSQILDQILVSRNLLYTANPIYDIVHINAEFAVQVSDHDPSVVRLTIR
jgi:predicted extracellular nuclease